MSSASAADCTHWRAKRSKPGATSEKQFLQFSWLAIGSMTFSRSLLSRRRQVEILSVTTNISFTTENKLVGRAPRAHRARARRSHPIALFSATPAGSVLRASLDARRLGGKLEAIPQKNSLSDCYRSRLRFANAHAN